MVSPEKYEETLRGKVLVDTGALPLVPDWYVIAIDETEYWNIDEEHRALIDRMLGVYMFNWRKHTYLCEVTPSYKLVFHSNVMWLKQELHSRDDFDELRDDLEHQYIYGGGTDNEPVTYMHSRDVDRRMNNYPELLYHYGTPSTYFEEDEGEEEVRDYVNGNSPF